MIDYAHTEYADPVRDVTEILTWLRARRYGTRAAADRAARAVAAFTAREDPSS